MLISHSSTTTDTLSLWLAPLYFKIKLQVLASSLPPEVFLSAGVKVNHYNYSGR